MPIAASSRRMAAALTVALVAMLLVTIGGATRATATSARPTVGTNHASPAPTPSRAQAGDLTAVHQHHDAHLDLTATLSVGDSADSSDIAVLAPGPVDAPLVRATTTPVGRAPPAA